MAAASSITPAYFTWSEFQTAPSRILSKRLEGERAYSTEPTRTWVVGERASRERWEGSIRWTRQSHQHHPSRGLRPSSGRQSAPVLVVLGVVSVCWRRLARLGKHQHQHDQHTTGRISLQVFPVPLPPPAWAARQRKFSKAGDVHDTPPRPRLDLRQVRERIERLEQPSGMSDENRLFAYDRSLTLIVVNAGHGLD